MKKYHSENRAAFAGALSFAFLTSSFAVVMQFFKGNVLDYAIEGEIQATLRYGLLLIIFILGEVFFHYIYRQFNAKHIVRST